MNLINTISHRVLKLGWGNPTGLVTSPKDGEENHPRRVIGSRQGSAVAAGHEEVGSSFPTCVAAKSLSSPGFGKNIKVVLPVLNISLNINLRT